jgi:hypothetical protein
VQSRASRAEIDDLQGRHAISEAIRRFAFSAEPSRAARMLWRANQPTVRFDYEMAMAKIATAPTRFRIRLRLRNHALDGAETWTPAANAHMQTTALRWALAWTI